MRARQTKMDIQFVYDACVYACIVALYMMLHGYCYKLTCTYQFRRITITNLTKD